MCVDVFGSTLRNNSRRCLHASLVVIATTLKQDVRMLRQSESTGGCKPVLTLLIVSLSLLSLLVLVLLTPGGCPQSHQPGEQEGPVALKALQLMLVVTSMIKCMLCAAIVCCCLLAIGYYVLLIIRVPRIRVAKTRRDSGFRDAHLQALDLGDCGTCAASSTPSMLS